MDWIANTISGLTPKRPVLIAGPTASGKSALALAIAERFGGTIINADAIQVYSDWRVLTARPSDEDEARAPHALYGHVGGDIAYSVGHWLRDIRPLLSQSTPIIVGGTGLYFAALTEGLADIPAVPSEIHTNARSRIENGELVSMIAELDAETRARIDLENPMRVQRAWEVLQSSGKGLAKWQDETPPADLPLDAAQALVVNGPVDWLNYRIEQRFGLMVADGALAEAEKNAPNWRPDLPSAKAIGAAELIAHVRGELSLDDAAEAVLTQTRQYAKRQRSWFRNRMKGWQWVDPSN